MNIALTFSTNKSDFRWKPTRSRCGWPLKPDKSKKVWYFDFYWLFFGLLINNEK